MNRSKRYGRGCVLIVITLILGCAKPLAAQGIYQFWGASQFGGKDDIGVLFSTDSGGGKLSGRHQFSYLNPGYAPGYGSMTPFNGKLYGLCMDNHGRLDEGLVFEFDPASGIYSRKAIIPSNTPDTYPELTGPMTVYNNQLYGVASQGGNLNNGELFKYDPAAGILTDLFEFNDTTGTYPSCGLTLVGNKMYGLTVNGGSGGGVLFEYDPDTGSYSIKIDLHTAGADFGDGGSLTLLNGKLYGTSQGGGSGGTGTLFEYDPAINSLTKKVDLSNATGYKAGGNALLVFNNQLWGMTPYGGDNNGGVIFQYDPATGVYTKKFNFSLPGGTNPNGSLVIAGNKMLGLTTHGGNNAAGVLFEYDPTSNVYTKKIDFVPINGSTSYGSLVSFNNTFYGYTDNGGTEDGGVIFAYDPVTAIYTKKIDLDGNSGAYPSGSLTWFNKILYGETENGGTAGSGTIYKYDLSTHTSSVEFNFDASLGRYPMGDLVVYNNKFYAMTLGGGLYDRGVIFSYDPVSKFYTKLFDFDSTNGGNPDAGNEVDFSQVDYSSSPLVMFNNKFYGTTHFGGTNNTGVLFEFDPLTNIYTKKHDFDYAMGLEPSGSLIQVNGKLYGLTSRGGTDNYGTLFEYDPAADVFAKKVDFHLADKLSDEAGLSVFNNKLYGVSAYGGDDAGFLFEYDPLTNVYTKKLNFENPTGDFPYGRLFLRNNLFYGTTSGGGIYNKGVVFSYNPLTNEYIKTADFDSLNNGGLPETMNLVSIPAAVADGNIGSCTALPDFTIDNANNNNWQGITDQYGDAVAELNPNGNDLGTISASLYVQNNPARIAGGLNYLNRSLTVTVQHQPATGQPVDIRLYIKKTELDDLINTPNSGIGSVNDLVVYKSESTCSNLIAGDVVPLSTTAADWGINYVLSTRVSSFSSFHFSSVKSSLPLTLLNFTASRKSVKQNQLDWQTSSETNTHYFAIERSANGIDFTTVGQLPAAGMSIVKTPYQFTDNYFSPGQLFYRLRMVDRDDKFTYSQIVKLAASTNAVIVISPNPATNTISIEGAGRFSQAQIIDANGNTVRQLAITPAGQYDISSLRAGIYAIRLVNDKEVFVTRFSKL